MKEQLSAPPFRYDQWVYKPGYPPFRITKIELSRAGMWVFSGFTRYHEQASGDSHELRLWDKSVIDDFGVELPEDEAFLQMYQNLHGDNGKLVLAEYLLDFKERLEALERKG